MRWLQIENIYINSLLFDFYGQLLTKRQYEILDLYFNANYSLGEIAEHLGISRQGVYDSINRGKARLDSYEIILKLAFKYLKNKSLVERALEAIEGIEEKNLKDIDRKKLKYVENSLKDLFENI